MNSFFYQQVIQRILHLWWLKALCTCAFMAVFFYGYFALLQSPAYSVVTMPLTAVDGAIPFQTGWFYIYASLWVYTSLVPALLVNLYKLFEYGVFITLLCGAGLGVFYLFPTAIPYADGAWGTDPLLRALRSVDLKGNAFPSLHVASAVFSACCLSRLFKELGGSLFIKTINWLWCAAIVYSTLAIKQHVIWDVAGGMVLAFAVNFVYKIRLNQSKH